MSNAPCAVLDLVERYSHDIYLFPYHPNWYVEHPTRQAHREVYQGRGGEWFLTTEEKKRILRRLFTPEDAELALYLTLVKSKLGRLLTPR